MQALLGSAAVVLVVEKEELVLLVVVVLLVIAVETLLTQASMLILAVLNPVGDNSASCSRSVRGKRNRPGVGAACGSRKDSFASRDTSNTGTAATTGTVLTT